MAVDESGPDLLLVDVLEDVRSIDENAQRSTDGDGKEDIQLKPIKHQRDVPPIIKNLSTLYTAYLLYLLNHISHYLNKICKICGLNPRLYTL